jgi:phosphonate transport system substrate-binding protein
MIARYHNTLVCRRRGAIGALLCVGACLLFLCAVPFGRSQEASAPISSGHLRIGLSSSLFAEMKENDAKLFLKVWTETMAKKLTLQTDTQPIILNGTAAVERALFKGQVDCATMTTVEFLTMSPGMQNGPLLLPVMNGQSREEYVLLVHKEGPIKEIKDLLGRSLNIFDHPRACLAPAWLDTLLLKDGLGTIEQCFGKVTRSKKTSQAVLSVFFRQAEVGLASRSAFKIAAELNPQVGQKLIVLASSPELVYIIYCFRPDYPVSDRNQVLAAISTMHDTPSGQQLQTVFKVDRLEEQSLACLDSARELMAQHKRLSDSAADPSLVQGKTGESK